jgi:hypothetical protein
MKVLHFEISSYVEGYQNNWQTSYPLQDLKPLISTVEKDNLQISNLHAELSGPPKV